MSRRPTRLAPLPLLAALACVPRPIAWDAPVPALAPASLDARLALAESGAAIIETPDFAAPAAPFDGCAASVRRARAVEGGPVYAAWWRARPDAGGELLVARSSDGGRTWSAPSVAEPVDSSGLGCARPAPAIAVDPVGGTVHLAYWATRAGGPGVWFTHATARDGVRAPSFAPTAAVADAAPHAAHDAAAMPGMSHSSGAPAADSSDVLWHAAVPIVSGERPSAAAAAVRGDTVAVAFEDPNSGPRVRVALAVSRTMGHTFALRDHEVSGADVGAAAPLVALGGGRIAVAWREDGTGGRLAVRAGRIDWTKVPAGE